MTKLQRMDFFVGILARKAFKIDNVISEAIPPPFSVRRIPTYLESIRYAEPWYAVRQQKCKWYAYAEFVFCKKKILKIRGTKLLKRIE